MMSLSDILADLGISPDETAVYETILETGPVTVQQLSRRMQRPRTSLYGFLNRLEAKGLTARSQSGGVTTFVALSPHRVSMLFEQKAEHLIDRHKQFRMLLPFLESAVREAARRPRFQLYEGAAGLKHILKDMLLYPDTVTSAFWPIRSMLDVLTADFFRYLNRERILNKITTRALWPRDQIVDPKDYPFLGAGLDFYREIRIAPHDLTTTMGYWLYGQKAAFVSSRAETFGFIIESPELVAMLQNQFDFLWNLSTPLYIDPKYTDVFLHELGLGKIEE